MNSTELKQRLGNVQKIFDGSFSDLMKIWRQLPQSQWETTFALQMRHLPEYTDLRKALTAFKNQFLGKQTNAKATSC